MAKHNPDWQVTSIDDKSGRVTWRCRMCGETVVTNRHDQPSDAEHGR